MRTFVSRWTWTCTAVLGICAASAGGCKSGPWSAPGAGFASWGKKDANSLAATKPSPNFPVSPSKNATPNATPNATSTASVGGGRPSGPAAGTSPANTSGGYPLSPTSSGAAGNSPPGVTQHSGIARSYGGASGAYGAGGAGPGGSGGAENGFYSSNLPGSNAANGNKFGAPGGAPGYSSNTGVERSGYDYQPASLKSNEYGAENGGGYNIAVAGGEFGGTPTRYPAESAGGAQRNPYASPSGDAPQPVRPPSYGPAGHDDAGHNHGHDHAHEHGHDDSGYAPASNYGTPRKPSGYERGSEGFAPPSRAPATNPSRGGYSSSGASPAGGLAMPSGFSPREGGYQPGSTRRSPGGPSAASDVWEQPSNVQPVGYDGASSGGSEAYDPSGTGGGFEAPSDDQPPTPGRFGSPSRGGSFDSEK